LPRSFSELTVATLAPTKAYVFGGKPSVSEKMVSLTLGGVPEMAIPSPIMP